MRKLEMYKLMTLVTFNASIFYIKNYTLKFAGDTSHFITFYCIPELNIGFILKFQTH